MQVISRSHAPLAYASASDVSCPCCRGRLVRQRRRIVDRLRSLVRPVRRYRCENFACQWIGNLAKPDVGRPYSGTAAGAKGAGDKEQRTSRVPASFVVHMVLVAVGVAFVIVYSTMEPTVWFDDSARTLELAGNE